MQTHLKIVEVMDFVEIRNQCRKNGHGLTIKTHNPRFIKLYVTYRPGRLTRFMGLILAAKSSVRRLVLPKEISLISIVNNLKTYCFVALLCLASEQVWAISRNNGTAACNPSLVSNPKQTLDLFPKSMSVAHLNEAFDELMTAIKAKSDERAIGPTIIVAANKYLADTIHAYLKMKLNRKIPLAQFESLTIYRDSLTELDLKMKRAHHVMVVNREDLDRGFSDKRLFENKRKLYTSIGQSAAQMIFVQRIQDGSSITERFINFLPEHNRVIPSLSVWIRYLIVPDESKG